MRERERNIDGGMVQGCVRKLNRKRKRKEETVNSDRKVGREWEEIKGKEEKDIAPGHAVSPLTHTC